MLRGGHETSHLSQCLGDDLRDPYERRADERASTELHRTRARLLPSLIFRASAIKAGRGRGGQRFHRVVI